MALHGKKIGFIGAGNMAEAIIRGLLNTGALRADQISASDVRQDRLDEIAKRYGIHPLSDNPLLVKRSDVIVLAVKPQVMGAVLKEIAPVVEEKLFISVAAGIPTSFIRSLLLATARLIRVMPNTPALVLEGATAVARSSGLDAGDLATAQEIFSAIGKVVVLEESLLDAVTGLSASGPAYIAMVVEALADGGVKMGLDRQTAMTLAIQTVLGTAKLLSETGMHPGQLKDMVASPGGTTIAGISALEENGLRHALIAAVERATRRSMELGRKGEDTHR